MRSNDDYPAVIPSLQVLCCETKAESARLHSNVPCANPFCQSGLRRAMSRETNELHCEAGQHSTCTPIGTAEGGTAVRAGDPDASAVG